MSLSREEKAALGFVALEVVIIILLLLVDQAPTTTPLTVNIGGVNVPADPINLMFENRPPNAYPLNLNLPPNPYAPPPTIMPGSPCACGCDGAGQTIYSPEGDLQSFVDQLNAAAKGGIVTQVQQFFSTIPQNLDFLTSNSRIQQFETFW